MRAVLLLAVAVGWLMSAHPALAKQYCGRALVYAITSTCGSFSRRTLEDLYSDSPDWDPYSDDDDGELERPPESHGELRNGGLGKLSRLFQLLGTKEQDPGGVSRRTPGLKRDYRSAQTMLENCCKYGCERSELAKMC